MATIARVIKAGSGTTNWVDGAGKTILSSEANADLNTIYDAFNGGIDNDNIKAGAGIEYSKLDLSGGIVNGDIAALAGIDGAKFLDGSIATAKLANMAVTTAKIAGNAVTSAAGPATANAPLALGVVGAWTNIAAPLIAGVTTGQTAYGVLMQFTGMVRATWGGSFDAGDSIGLLMRLVTRTGGVDTVQRTFHVHHLETPEDPDTDSNGVPFHLHAFIGALAVATYDFKVQYFIYNNAGGVTAPVYTLSPTLAGAPANGDAHLSVILLAK